LTPRPCANIFALSEVFRCHHRLGYFKPIAGGKGVDVQKTPGEHNRVDVKMRLEDR
jgi:hypothetical protein